MFSRSGTTDSAETESETIGDVAYRSTRCYCWARIAFPRSTIPSWVIGVSKRDIILPRHDIDLPWSDIRLFRSSGCVRRSETQRLPSVHEAGKFWSEEQGRLSRWRRQSDVRWHRNEYGWLHTQPISSRRRISPKQPQHLTDPSTTAAVGQPSTISSDGLVSSTSPASKFNIKRQLHSRCRNGCSTRWRVVWSRRSTRQMEWWLHRRRSGRHSGTTKHCRSFVLAGCRNSR